VAAVELHDYPDRRGELVDPGVGQRQHAELDEHRQDSDHQRDDARRLGRQRRQPHGTTPLRSGMRQAAVLS
jgi:hypothetical protein